MNKYIKLVIAAVLIALAIFLFTIREYGWGFVSLLVAVFPILFYFRNENILLAFWFLRKEDMAKAKKWLQKIKNPSSEVIPKQMGYYHYMMGITEAQDNVAVSEKYMKEALNYGLSFDHDRAMANLSLAGAAMSKGKKKEAEGYIKEAKKNDSKGMFTDQIKMMNDQMKRFNVSNSQLQNPHMRHKGRKF
ncbi:tetratricopeptide repeat protein [Empedobacter falsenii]|uniref:tetratricopeptide repeat protein n=1 Tax=unclassified Empedobacter TaxID=2643773 RepID=UPI0025BB41CD|nr:MULTISPECIES: DUF2892 domain-containing protein [unclassified Empedobacter]